MLLIIVLAFLVQSTYSVSASPTWTINPLLNSGEHKPIFQTTGSGIVPTAATMVTQTFNTSFSTAPRVILSLLGYRQNAPCLGCQVGFKNQILTTSTTSFTANFSVYGANMFYLIYNYMGISFAATQYFTSYQLLTFTSGNLVNNTNSSRSITQIIPNPPGQSFPNFATSPVISTTFLSGFKMNLGTTGTYINLTTTIVSNNSYSVTISTIGDVQIFQVCYYRIAYDKSIAMQGYKYISDYFYYWGVNSTQRATTTTVTSSSFQYRNYLMGFNQINIASTTTQTDILLQMYITPQTIFSCNSALGNFSNTVYAYLWADVFHLRRPICGASTPYFYFQTLLCYDICPQKTYLNTPANYCQNCHYSCLTCSNTQNTNCLSCSATDFRTFNSATSQCLCSNGYFQNGTTICATCSSQCLTCISSATYCLTCNTLTHYRTINLTTHTCPCINGYYETSLYSPLICLACHATCLTCSLTSTNCITCDYINQNRILSIPDNACICKNGFYETFTNNPAICLACDSSCVTCSITSTNCTSCNSTYIRVLNSSSYYCMCQNGFYEISNYNPVICLVCNPICLTCQSSSTHCTSCNATYNRNFSNNTCICLSGFYEISVGSPLVCLTCHQTCITCITSSTTCQSCDSVIQHRIFNSTNSVCQCIPGYFEINLNNAFNCLTCHPVCMTCQVIATNCLSCDSLNHHRSLNTAINSCQCMAGYYQTSLNTPSTCLICNSNCLTCSVSSTSCTFCNTTANRYLDTTTLTCKCLNGFYQDTINGTGCQLCSLTGCLSCTLSTIVFQQTCLLCNSSLNLILNYVTSSLSNCACQQTFYIDSNTNLCAACNYKCLTCTDSLSCSTCSSANNRQLNSNISSLCQCKTGYLEVVNNPICIKCDIKCLICTYSAFNCLTCDQSKRTYINNGSIGSCVCNNGTQQSFVIYGLCIQKNQNGPICGNGIIQQDEQCDDFNILSNDGCSDLCYIQPKHFCGFYSNTNGTSLCYYNQQLTMTISSVLKDLDDNKITIVIKIQALLCNLQKLKEYLNKMIAIQLIISRRILQQEIDKRLLQNNQIIYISQANFIITDSTNYQGYLNLKLNYTESISTLKNKQLKFINSNNQYNSQYFFNTPHSLAMLEDPYNNVPINFYQASSYQSVMSLSYIFLALCGLNILFFIILIVFKKTVIAIQNILILQFAYFCITCQKQVQLAIGNLAQWGRFSIGVNIKLVQTGTNQFFNYQSCVKMGKIYQTCNTVNNINITFLIATLLFCFVIGCSLFKYIKQKKLNQTPLKTNSNQQQLQNQQQKQSHHSNQLNIHLTYQFPNKIKQMILLSLQFIYGIYFMTAIQFLLSIINQQKQLKIIGIIETAVIGLLFLFLWTFWIKFYPLDELSYHQVIVYRVQKISIYKYFYLSIFMLLVIWGAIISVAPAIASYSFLIIICLFWISTTLRFQIYKQKLNKIRANINQIITILIVVIYILLEYLPNDGLGLIYALAILIFLFLSLINNVVIFIYLEKTQRKNKNIVYNEQLKQIQQGIYNNSYTSRVLKNNQKNNSIHGDIIRNRQPLIQATQIKSTVRNKVTELKTFRKQLKIPKIQANTLSDQRREQFLNSFRLQKNLAKIEISFEEDQYKDI